MNVSYDIEWVKLSDINRLFLIKSLKVKFKNLTDKYNHLFLFQTQLPVLHWH